MLDVRIKDALNVCGDRTGASNDYCRGIIVGVVSALMASGLSFDKAFELVRSHIPDNTRGAAIFPASWI